MNWIWSKTSRKIAWVLAAMFLWSGAGQQAAQAAVQSCKELRDLAVPQCRTLSDNEMAGILGGCPPPPPPCPPGTPPCQCNNSGDGGTAGSGGGGGGCKTCVLQGSHPGVNSLNGNMSQSALVAAGASSGAGPTNAQLNYNTQETKAGCFGQGWSNSLSASLTESPSGITTANLVIVSPNGQRLYFTGNNPDWKTSSIATFTGAAGVKSTLTKMSGNYQLLAGNSATMDDGGDVVHAFGPVNGGSALLGSIQREGISSSIYVCSLEYSGGNISAAVDAAGNRTTFSYIDGTSRVSNIQAPGNIRTTFQYTQNTDGKYDLSAAIYPTDTGQPPTTYSYTYDTAHKMRSIKDSLNHITTYTYSDTGGTPLSTGRLIEVRDPLNNRTTYAYTPSAGAVGTMLVKNPAGAITTVVNDSANWVRKYDVDAAGNYTTYSYNADRQILAKTYKIDGQLCTETYSYNSAGRKTKGLYSPMNTSVVYTYYANNDLMSETNENGETTVFTYDNHRLATIQSPLGNLTTYVYDSSANGPIQSAMTCEGVISSVTYTYESAGAAAGKMKTVVDALGNITTSSFDTNGRLSSTKVSPSGGVTYTTTVDYDLMGRKRLFTNPDNTQVGYYYDCCHLKTITDENGNVTSMDYWPDGRLMVTTDSMDGASWTSYGYNTSNNTSWVKLTNAVGNISTCVYDNRGLLTSLQYADGTSENYAYEQSGAIKSKVDARGQRTTYSYNTRGWLTNTAYPNDSAVVLYYDNSGRRTGMTDASGATSYTYYADGRLYTKRTALTGISEKLTTYCYDANGAIASVQCNGYTTTNHYDLAGRLLWLSNSEGQKVTHTYDCIGRTIRRSLDNGAYTSYGYNNRGWIMDVQNMKRNGNSVLSRFSYYYNDGGATDSAGNILKTVQTLSDGNTYTSTYTYDNDYRLTCERMSGATTYGYAYTYDGVGNRNTLAVDGGGATTYTYDHNANSELRTECSGGTTNTYTYDTRGNMLTKTISGGGGITTYTYNDMNKIINISYPGGTSTAYVYDGDGNRVKKVGTDGVAEYYLYDGSNLHVVLDSSGNNKERYDYDTYGVVYKRTEGVGTYYFGNDHLGSVWNAVTLDNNESIVGTYTYTAFGNTTASDSIGNPFRYVGAKGYFSDYADSGLMLLGARYYSPSIGRFVTIDPIRDGRNWYSYVENKPTLLVDPTGLKCQSFDDCFGNGSLRISEAVERMKASCPFRFPNNKQLEDQCEGDADMLGAALVAALAIRCWWQGRNCHDDDACPKKHRAIHPGDPGWPTISRPRPSI